MVAALFAVPAPMAAVDPFVVVEVAEALHAVEVALCADDERLSQYIIVGCSELVRFIAGGGQKVRPSHGFRYAQTIR